MVAIKREVESREGWPRRDLRHGLRRRWHGCEAAEGTDGRNHVRYPPTAIFMARDSCFRVEKATADMSDAGQWCLRWLLERTVVRGIRWLRGEGSEDSMGESEWAGHLGCAEMGQGCTAGGVLCARVHTQVRGLERIQGRDFFLGM